MIFEVSQLAVSVAEKCLLRDVNLSLYKREVVALTGASGSGKTSLLRVLCGLEDAVSGTIRLENRTPDEWGWPAFRRNAVLMEQKPTLRDASVEDNLRRAFSFQANTMQVFSASEATNIFSRLHLEPDMMTQNARTLSVGQQQRVCFARALLLKPQVLLLDEPTSALDTDAARAVEVVLREYVETQNAAAIVVTHNARQRDECDRVFDLTPFCANGNAK